MKVRVDEWMRVEVRQRDPPVTAGIAMQDFEDERGRKWQAGDVIVNIDGERIVVSFDAFLELFTIK